MNTTRICRTTLTLEAPQGQSLAGPYPTLQVEPKMDAE